MVSDESDAIRTAGKLILPGVGAFDAGMQSLRARGLDEAVREAVGNGAYVLGICLGMQFLMDGSEEGQLPGLGLIRGCARRFVFDDPRLKIPHMGINVVRPARDGSWAVELNSQTLPRVLINRRYHAAVSRGAKRETDRLYVDECHAKAAWLVKSLDQRAKTILAVAREIVRRELTIVFVPMLNPDGAELFRRENAAGIDVNRDALRLQTPEGQVLKTLRDRLRPRVGFNLHNQSWNTTAGRPPVPAAISLLSVAYDEARTVNEGRLLTKRLGAVVRDALEPLAPGRIGKYDDEFEVRAFGDNLTKWGTPVLLIETGPWPEANPDPALVRRVG